MHPRCDAPRSPVGASPEPADLDELDDASGAGRRGSMSRDLISAYAASGAKVLSWAFLSSDPGLAQVLSHDEEVGHGRGMLS